MSSTITRHHPWCHEHVQDNYYSDSGVWVDGFCQSREVEAHGLRVLLSAVSPERPVVEIIGSNGRHVEITPEEVQPLIGALLWAKSQVEQ